jgi:hypothetical protein
MAQELHIRDGGTWKEATEVHIRDAGTWKEATEVYIRDAGAWVLAFIKEALIWSGVDSNSTFGVSENAERNGFSVLSNGTAEICNNSGVYGSMAGWLSSSPVNINDYEMRWTATGTKTFSSPFAESASVFTNMQTGTWEYAAAQANRTATITVVIRKDGDASSEVSKAITLTQNYEP